MREETGYSAERWQEIARLHLSNSVSDEEAYCYLATELKEGIAEPEGTEELRVRWVPFAEALAMTADGRITDAAHRCRAATRCADEAPRNVNNQPRISGIGSPSSRSCVGRPVKSLSFCFGSMPRA